MAETRSAVWARELTERSKDLSAVNESVWVESVLRRVEEAASNGRSHVEMLPGHPNDVMVTTLRELGFTVIIIKYQRDGEYTKISW